MTKDNGKRRNRERKKGATYFITCNINRFQSELSDNVIKMMLIQVLSEAKLKFNFEMIDYEILDDHFDIIIKPDENEDEYYLSKIMKWILGVFASRYNKYTGQKGSLWHDKYKSEIIESGVEIINPNFDNCA